MPGYRRSHRDPRFWQLLAALSRPRVGRNPKTGQSVSLEGKFVPHFKPGKELRDRVNEEDEAEA